MLLCHNDFVAGRSGTGGVPVIYLNGVVSSERVRRLARKYYKQDRRMGIDRQRARHIARLFIFEAHRLEVV